jgi:hypothetical protein
LGQTGSTEWNDFAAEDAGSEDDIVEADLRADSRRRTRRSRRAQQSLPPPIQLLVRKAEPAEPVGTVISGLPIPRNPHVHFPPNDPPPEASSSKHNPVDEVPASTSGVYLGLPDSSARTQGGDVGSKDLNPTPLVNLLAPHPAERKEAKDEVRKLKKGKARDYVWDGEFVYTTGGTDARTHR